MTETAPIGRKARRRFARGQSRPRYLDPSDVDRLMIMFVALMSEVSALRDRLDTHEALAEQGKQPDTAAVEAYQVEGERADARERERSGMLRRVLRVITEERDAAATDGTGKATGLAELGEAPAGMAANDDTGDGR